jgi:hypothetical protein
MVGPNLQYDALLKDPQFTMAEVASVAGITETQLKGVLDRKEVVLSRHSPGSGRRRLASGGEVLEIATTFTVNEIGYPQKWAWVLAEHVRRRAMFRRAGCDVNAHRGALCIASYPLPDGDWQHIEIWANEPRPALPISYQVLEVDRLIDETIAKLEALVEDKLEALVEDRNGGGS